MSVAEGPGAIVKVIDRRLSGLERAKSFIEWDKARAFRDDLRSLTGTITSELAPAAPALAMDRILRFIATHERVLARVDDHSRPKVARKDHHLRQASLQTPQPDRDHVRQAQGLASCRNPL